MAVQILTLKLDGITADDYLAWCRDPDPPALDFALRSMSIDAGPLGDTITAALDWNQPAPSPAAAAAAAAGLSLTAEVEIQRLLTDRSEPGVSGPAADRHHQAAGPPAVQELASARPSGRGASPAMSSARCSSSPRR